MFPAGAIARGAAASLPLARAAARKIIAAGGRVLGSRAGRVAVGVGTGIGVLAPAFGGGFPFGAGAPRRRRARGITATELRGARKVAQLVRMYGLKPKSGYIRGRRRKKC